MTDVEASCCLSSARDHMRPDSAHDHMRPDSARDHMRPDSARDHMRPDSGIRKHVPCRKSQQGVLRSQRHSKGKIVYADKSCYEGEGQLVVLLSARNRGVHEVLSD